MDNQPGMPIEMGPGGGPRASAGNAVSIPAILLMVLSGLTILWLLSGLARPANPDDVERVLRAYGDLPEQTREMVRTFTRPAATLLITLPFILVNALIFFGALRMKQLRGYGLAMTSAILSCVPCCGPCLCLGIPVGIWALLTLNKPEVKSSFT